MSKKTANTTTISKFVEQALQDIQNHNYQLPIITLNNMDKRSALVALGYLMQKLENTIYSNAFLYRLEINAGL